MNKKYISLLFFLITVIFSLVFIFVVLPFFKDKSINQKQTDITRSSNNPTPTVLDLSDFSVLSCQGEQTQRYSVYIASIPQDTVVTTTENTLGCHFLLKNGEKTYMEFDFYEGASHSKLTYQQSENVPSSLKNLKRVRTSELITSFANYSFANVYTDETAFLQGQACDEPLTNRFGKSPCVYTGYTFFPLVGEKEITVGIYCSVEPDLVKLCDSIVKRIYFSTDNGRIYPTE